MSSTGKQIATVDSLTFVSNDNKWEVEAFLVKPLGLQENAQDTSPAKKYPMIVELHGGPHGQNGPAFNFQDQVYAAHGWATLHVNYRGSTGYGQKFADAVFGDQDGDEGQDVLYAVSAAARRNLWIDRERMGIEGVSYGGQLSDWLITQTNEFKAAVPIAGITNLISYNYITYYNQYEEMEFGQFFTRARPWTRRGSARRSATSRRSTRRPCSSTATTIRTSRPRKPSSTTSRSRTSASRRCSCGTRAKATAWPKPSHVIDDINRKFPWYEEHFPQPVAERVTNVQP